MRKHRLRNRVTLAAGTALLLLASANATAASAEEDNPDPPIEKLTDTEPPAPSVEGPGTPVAPEGEMPPEDQASIKAGPHYHMYTDDSDNGGWVEFFTVGDEVRMGDRTSDGRGVEIDVWNESSAPDSYEFGWYEGRGKGKWQYSKASMGQPWNMAEGDCFKFRISTGGQRQRRLWFDGLRTMVEQKRRRPGREL
ncbi:hypothetical protein [Streptomyces sp. S465]|uniref:hypothetical protein n=1 Tax=Streptomyces sp. S465 TaxID=2979468 RepID=UPI0022A80F9E|nr:hypothetical protein [Streptomyces sp. S465]WAP55044.1 hypothetical protein N6H00_08625 [Streptomyces sp. S465]